MTWSFEDTTGSAGSAVPLSSNYSESRHIRTYFFERETEIGSYFKGTNTNLKV